MRLPQQERRIWSQQIKEVGAPRAYEDFKKTYAKMDHGLQHKLAHVFGDLLYDKFGLEGLKVCDASFVFGCYHKFLERVLREKGLDALVLLDRACTERGKDRLGCHHGIGHGIMIYFGEDRLLEALEACSKLSWRGVGGCAGGLFMEYNFKNVREIETGVPAKIREFDPSDPFSPCSILPAKFKSACFYEQPDWWKSAFGGDFEKIAKLCRGLEDASYREFCFIGTGRVIAQSVSYNIQDTIAICDKIPFQDNILCRAGGFLSILDYKKDPYYSASVCSDLDQESRSLCLRKANLFGTAPIK